MRRDHHTPDLFALPGIPQPAPERPGSMDFRTEVAHELGELIRDSGLDRYEISARVSRLAGRPVSKAMIDGYTSEAREEFNLCLALVPVFEAVCRSTQLTRWAAAKRGGELLIGRDALSAELGRIEEQRAALNERAALLKDVLKRSRA